MEFTDSSDIWASQSAQPTSINTPYKLPLIGICYDVNVRYQGKVQQESPSFPNSYPEILAKCSRIVMPAKKKSPVEEVNSHNSLHIITLLEVGVQIYLDYYVTMVA